MSRQFKRIAYRISKWLGLFALARRYTAAELRILCYHGLSIRDEHLYMPGLFMRPKTVRSRLAMLQGNGYPVLLLSEAIERLSAGTLPPCSVVITYDDGFYGNYVCGLPLFEEFRVPSTIYVTSYYVVNQNPIFRHVVQYMFWKTDHHKLVLDGFPGCPPGTLDLQDHERTRSAMWDLILAAEANLDESARLAIGAELGTRLGVDFDELVASRRLSLMTEGEVRSLAGLGVDIQLHTHRHQFLPDKCHVEREISDNRAVLEPVAGKPCNHLCYPSGVFTHQQWPWLEELGIESATTCEPGLNNPQTPRLGLRRFLDMETISAIEFEAEISGFAELLRRLARRKTRITVSPSAHMR
jgi:peptidoglycan/xylan/chitin deacetylase (PgdA/CDA1 family)